MGRLMRGSIVGGLFLWGLGSLSGDLIRAVSAQSPGSISGRVMISGDAPQPRKLEITKDKEKCGTEKLAEDLVVSPDRGVKNAVVSLIGVKGSGAKADKSVVLDQRGCAFSPRVVVAATGAPIDILNNDGILHNVHTYSTKNTPINKAQPGFKKKMTETFGQPEIIKLTCDAHPWMVGWIVVTDHPYATPTDGSGSFRLTDVPPGTHKVEVWHETLGKLTKEVTVKAGEEASVTFELVKK